MLGGQDLLEQTQNLQVAFFGVMYTVSKERWDASPQYALLKLVVDWLQLFLLLVLPAYGWVFTQKVWIWEAIQWVQFRLPIVALVSTPTAHHPPPNCLPGSGLSRGIVPNPAACRLWLE